MDIGVGSWVVCVKDCDLPKNKPLLVSGLRHFGLVYVAVTDGRCAHPTCPGGWTAGVLLHDHPCLPHQSWCPCAFAPYHGPELEALRREVNAPSDGLVPA
jgi:hypothetical protein